MQHVGIAAVPLKILHMLKIMSSAATSANWLCTSCSQLGSHLLLYKLSFQALTILLCLLPFLHFPEGCLLPCSPGLLLYSLKSLRARVWNEREIYNTPNSIISRTSVPAQMSMEQALASTEAVDSKLRALLQMLWGNQPHSGEPRARVHIHLKPLVYPGMLGLQVLKFLQLTTLPLSSLLFSLHVSIGHACTIYCA